MKYLALLRGINVGGKNKLKMAELKDHFEELGFENALTYIQSGNVIFESELPAMQITKLIEDSLPRTFKLDSQLIKAFVLTQAEFKDIAAKAPPKFGQEPEKYYSDFIFLKDVSVDEVLPNIELNPEVDSVWPGPNVLYFRRLGAKRTSSRLSKIISKPVYKNMTIRSATTVAKLLALMNS